MLLSSLLAARTCTTLASCAAERLTEQQVPSICPATWVLARCGSVFAQIHPKNLKRLESGLAMVSSKREGTQGRISILGLPVQSVAW